MRYIYCIFLYMPLIIDICQSGMEIGLAWCGGASARGFKVRVLRWRSGVAGALLRRGAAVAAGASNRRSRSTQSTRRGSLTLALFLGVGAALAAQGLWLPSACPGRAADLCRAIIRLVGHWGCCHVARTLRCALRIASTLLGFHLDLFLGFVLHSTLP